MVNYDNSKIYKIVCNKTGLCYIGSTTQSLSSRLSHHCAMHKRNLENKGVSSSKVLENNDYSIILIENYPCKNKEELYRKEREYIEKIDCVNKIKRPYRSDEEAKEYGNKYRIENKDRLTELNKEYRKENKEEIYLKRKQFREDNKERLSEISKEYYRTQIEPNKFICECGTTIIKNRLDDHLKTAKHLGYITEKYGIETTTEKYFCECGSEVSNLELHYQTDKHRVYMAQRVSDEPLKIEIRKTVVQTASELKEIKEAKAIQKNKEIQEAKVTCDCGAVLSNEFALKLHLETKRHKDLLEAKNKPPEVIVKPEPFKEFNCECGMVIKQLWHVDTHKQSKKHLDLIRKKNQVNSKSIVCSCGTEVKGEHRYQKHMGSDVHKKALAKKLKSDVCIETEPETSKTTDETEIETETSEIKVESDVNEDELIIYEPEESLEIKPYENPLLLEQDQQLLHKRNRNKEKLTCVCGVVFSRSCQARHRESKAHQDYLKNHPEQAELETKGGTTCECGAVISSGSRNLARHQTSEKHKRYMDVIKAGKSIKEFLQEEKAQVKEKDKARRSENIMCECGLSYTKTHKTRHIQNKQHMKFIESKN
jgi:GIY-YIG catalytic domain